LTFFYNGRSRRTVEIKKKKKESRRNEANNAKRSKKHIRYQKRKGVLRSMLVRKLEELITPRKGQGEKKGELCVIKRGVRCWGSGGRGDSEIKIIL